ncbi:jhamt [Trichonephila clavata]|uniref:Jhamt n=1 Tax=Trichonephila clavata TaxID=2740835 RepID=A0A8X6KFA8_TRICU|nr:jhamt [Trichonephila clavata]
MAESSSSLETFAHYDFSIQFVQRCADEFQWKDLSEDVVMDIGCGDELNCCKAIIIQFPEVKALIAVDTDSTVFETARFMNRIEFCVGDIRERDSLESYEGKMDKVISAHTFHYIIDKETAFRNAYRLLKPGGEAGFFFCVNSYMYEFLTVLREIQNYEAIIKDTFALNLYATELGKQYKELLEKIGFKHVRAFEEELKFPFSLDECFKDFLEVLDINLVLSPEDAEKFKAIILHLYEKKFGKIERNPRYVSVQLSLLGVKPMESSD